MTYRARYSDARQWRQAGLWVSATFAGTGSGNAQTHDVTFAQPFALTPGVVVFSHIDPTTAVAWATNVSATGFTINVYRASGTGGITVRWTADVPTQ